LIFPGYASAQEKKWSPAAYKDIPFKVFAASTQSLQKIRFFYKDEWVKDLTLKEYPENYTLSDLLDDLLRGKGIYYYID
jgi:N-acetyl-beta-hexosaminidase